MSLHVKNLVCSLRTRGVSSLVIGQSAPRAFQGRNLPLTRGWWSLCCVYALLTQINLGFNTTPFVWCENKIPIRVNESVDAIEGELSTLFKEGQQNPDLVSYAESFQLRRDMLESKGFKVCCYFSRAAVFLTRNSWSKAKMKLLSKDQRKEEG